MTRKSLLATAALAMTIGTGATAGSVDIEYLGSATGSNSPSITIDNAPVGGTGGSLAFGFNMEVTPASGPVFDILAWCLDLEHTISTGTFPYVHTTTPFSNSFGLDGAQRGRVQAVFDANYETLDPTDEVESGGFQVALWNALYDDDFDAANGSFAASDDSVTGVIAAANGFLGAASSFTGDKAFNLTFYESTDDPVRQNLVTATPVPLPAALWMLAGALGGLGALRRWRRA